MSSPTTSNPTEVDDSRILKPTGRSRAKLVVKLTNRAVVVLVLVGLLVFSLRVSQVDFSALMRGLPVLANWSMRAFPPDFRDWDLLLLRMAETIAMAVAGTAFAAVLAIPLTIFGTRQLSPSGFLYASARLVMNFSRGVDAFIFAILFVAAVGLGPFAGVIGIALHSCGSLAKLWSEAIEAVDRRPAIALSVMGLPKASIWLMAVVPAMLPSMCSQLLYIWEANVRSSTVLGLVGAGGIGQELKNSVDLLIFDRMTAILIIVLIVVTGIDLLSAWLRRRLL